jgi:hypothetical protein
MCELINTFDIDGVILLDLEGVTGVAPLPKDIIVTGRSYEEMTETLDSLNSIGVFNQVFFNHVPYTEKTRESSGQHKAKIIKTLVDQGLHGVHYEDDPVQIKEIKKIVPNVRIIHVNSNKYTELENKRR